jgi:4-amino-4-deoxy-L-arabinose transferase-like glycosyltransferase
MDTLKKITKQIKPWHLVSLFSIFILFFIIRLINLNGLPVFVDEAIYVRWAQVMKSEPTLRFLPQSDGKQPLFMWSMIPAFKVISDPVMAGRILSVLAGFGSLLGLVTLSFLLFASIPLSLLTGLIYAVTPYTVFFDRLALVDSLLAMFGVWSLVVGYLYVKKPRLDLSLILGGVLGLGLLTKSPAVFFYTWQIILAFFLFKPSRKKPLHSWLALLGGWLVALIVSQAIFNVLRLGPNFHMIGSRNQDYLFSFSEVLRHPLNPLVGNLKSTFSWIANLFTFSLAIMIPFIFINPKTRRSSSLLLVVSLIPLLAQALIAKVYTPRYLFYAIIPLTIAISKGLISVVQGIKLKSPKLRYIFPLILLLFAFLTSLRYVLTPEKVDMPRRMRHGYLEEWTAGWGQKDLADYLIDLASKGQGIVVGTEGYFGTLPDGLQIYTEKKPHITVIGIGQPAVKIPEPLENTSKENLIFLVINKSRNQLKPHHLQQLELVKSYPKPARPDGTQEELQVYQLIPQSLPN